MDKITVSDMFKEIISLGEAALIWGLGESTLRVAISRGRFEETEYRKSGKVWLITRSAMRRVYGPEPGESRIVK